MQAVDREDELGDWLDERDVDRRLGPRRRCSSQGGLDLDCLERIAEAVDAGVLDRRCTGWRTRVETEQLMTDIEDATGRISSLVAAAKQYSQMDRAAAPVDRRARAGWTRRW